MKDFIIAVDFDGTVVKHRFPEVGEDVPNAAPVLRYLVQNGVKVILFTMRSDMPGKRQYLTEAKEWFAKNDIPLFGVNENPDQKSWTTSPKPYAHAYIDDMAVGVPLLDDGVRPFVHWYGIWSHLDERGFHTEKIITPEPAQ